MVAGDDVTDGEAKGLDRFGLVRGEEVAIPDQQEMGLGGGTERCGWRPGTRRGGRAGGFGASAGTSPMARMIAWRWRRRISPRMVSMSGNWRRMVCGDMAQAEGEFASCGWRCGRRWP